MIELHEAIKIALKDCAYKFGREPIHVTVLRAERVRNHWEVDIKHVYLQDCIIFPYEVYFDGKTVSYTIDAVDFPAEFQYLERYMNRHEDVDACLPYWEQSKKRHKRGLLG